MARQALTFVVAGIIVGLGAALATSRALSSLLFGVTPTDAITFLTVPIVLAVVAVAAAYVPARRAQRVDPNVALRAE